MDSPWSLGRCRCGNVGSMYKGRCTDCADYTEEQYAWLSRCTGCDANGRVLDLGLCEGCVDAQAKEYEMSEKKTVLDGFSSNHYYYGTANGLKPNNEKSNVMNTIAKYAPYIAILLFTLFLFRNGDRTQEIVHPSWSEGTFHCEWHSTISGWIPVDTGTKAGVLMMKNQDHGSYAVNEGHTDDNELNELMDAVPSLCGWKANQRPLWQRMGGIAGHNHFTVEDSLDIIAVQDEGYMQDHDFSWDFQEGEGGMVMDSNTLAAHMAECDGDFNLITVGK